MYFFLPRILHSDEQSPVYPRGICGGTRKLAGRDRARALTSTTFVQLCLVLAELG